MPRQHGSSTQPTRAPGSPKAMSTTTWYVETGDVERTDLLDLALQSYYSATLQMKDAPVGAYIREKALVSQGNIYLAMARRGPLRSFSVYATV